MFFFFFQAEDGIRDRDVTGVQTCALPIYKVDILDHESFKKVVRGTVVDISTGKAITTKITVINEEDHNLNGIYRSNPNNGNFIMVVRPMEYYQFIVEAAGYQTMTINFSYEDLNEIEELNINLKPIVE